MSTIRSLSRVTAPARLHLGFLDPGASLGRRFGSIGLSIEGVATVVTAETHGELVLDGLHGERERRMVDQIIAHYALPTACRITVGDRIPQHAGLGSGTQFALALGTALTGLFGKDAGAPEIGSLLRRGKRSGVGLGLFELGGLIVDAGHGAHTLTPPTVSRLNFPEDWRVVLISDTAQSGLSGSAEIAAFRDLPALPQRQAAHLCHLTLMGILPAIVERDFDAFSGCLGEVQAVIGDYFASAQRGRFKSERVAEAVALCAHEFALRGVGQSSWGPTAFAFVRDEDAGRRILATLQTRFQRRSGLRFQVVAPRNRGATIDHQEDRGTQHRRTG